MLQESWKDIAGYEGLYRVSDIGNLMRYEKLVTSGVKNRAIKIYPEDILIQTITKQGYKRVRLNKNGKVKNFLIHRLVAMAFIPNPDKKLYVNHINGVKDDNMVENLEWCSSSENQAHAYQTGLKTITKKMDRSRPVRCLTNGLLFPSVVKAAVELNVRSSGITQVCRGFIKNTKNLVFRYE